MYSAPPALVFAVAGQARADGWLSPEQESRLLSTLLTHWALQHTLADLVRCAAPPVNDTMTLEGEDYGISDWHWRLLERAHPAFF
jgi:hypothetical protein